MAQGGAQPEGAWFRKKAEKFGQAQRRWFQLVGREITYFDSVKDGVGVKEKGKIALERTCTVRASGIDLIITTPERTWTLAAETSVQATRWTQLIQAAITGPASPPAASVVPGGIVTSSLSSPARAPTITASTIAAVAPVTTPLSPTTPPVSSTPALLPTSPAVAVPDAVPSGILTGFVEPLAMFGT